MSRPEFEEEIVASLREEFLKRQEERRPYELQWRLNQSFLCGREAVLSARGELEEEEGRYEWERRENFNNIAPILDTRCAKLARVRPTMTVRSASGKEEDVYAAKLATKLLKSFSANADLPGKIAEATRWSETLGTAFYRIKWNAGKGKRIAENLTEGDAEIEVLSAYEVYPFNLSEESLERQPSVILARAVPVSEIFDRFGKEVEEENVQSCAQDFRCESLKGHCLFLERFEKPTSERPEGRYTAVAGNLLLLDGSLPYATGREGAFAYPFVKQVAVGLAGRFFGVSVIERLIPVQRAYNAVKNRKYEFLNRIAAGVYAVEDGSVDTDDLEENGLRPGKILLYRQGSRPPFVLDYSRVPADFNYEEDRLQNEFIRISGVSEITRNSQLPSGVSSGVALSILVEQDETRLSVTAENIRAAVRELGGMAVRLYRQFAGETRLLHVNDEAGDLECYYFKGSDLCADDVVFDTENELLETPAQKKSYIFDLLSNGLFSGEDGRLSEYTRAKILDMLGFGSVENGQELASLHIKQAGRENIRLLKESAEVSEIDDHGIHIKEHTKYMLSNGLVTSERFVEHVRAHRLLSGVEK